MDRGLNEAWQRKSDASVKASEEAAERNEAEREEEIAHMEATLVRLREPCGDQRNCCERCCRVGELCR